MSARYVYERMSAEEFAQALAAIGWHDGYRFAFVTGAKIETVQKWVRAEQDVPHWVRLVLVQLGTREGRDEAMRLAEVFGRYSEAAERSYGRKYGGREGAV